MTERTATREGKLGVENFGTNVGAARELGEWHEPQGTDRCSHGGLGREDRIGIARFHRGSKAIEGHGETSENVSFCRHGPG